MPESNEEIRENKTYFRKLIYFGMDFKETYEVFEKLVAIDKDFLSTIPEKERKRRKKLGLTSHAIRCLISDYVEDNKAAFTARQRRPQNTTVQQNQATNNQTNNSEASN